MGAKSEDISGILAKSVAPLIAPDGKTAVLQFTLDSGKTVNIAFDSDQAAGLLHSLGALMSSSLPTAPGGVGFVRMTQVTKVNAHPTEVAGQIALGLIDTAGIPHYFSFPAATSTALRSALRSAESNSKTGIRIPRA
jgi:hypothetical protein